jgi:putative Mg2+ transporter-C (MgtC) family protein
MTYRTGTALLPRLMETCTRRGFRILQVRVDRLPGRADPAARVLLELEGPTDTGTLTSELFHNDGVIDIEVTATDDDG